MAIPWGPCAKGRGLCSLLAAYRQMRVFRVHTALLSGKLQSFLPLPIVRRALTLKPFRSEVESQLCSMTLDKLLRFHL